MQSIALERTLGSVVDDSTRSNCGPSIQLNDVQSQLNATNVHQIFQPICVDDIVGVIRMAERIQRPISVAGGRNSMGGQQFAFQSIHIDMTTFNRVIDLDCDRGLVTVEAGIQWPALIDELHRLQPGDEEPWTIRTKQTGVDAVTIGGSLASNVHGRGLRKGPIVEDVESFDLVDARGKLTHCSRTENAELFSLAIGGYGLFGIIAHVTLRLNRRFKVRRRVEVIRVLDLIEKIEQRIEDGFVFGDCQYAPELVGETEQHQGVFPCYEPVSIDTPIPERQTQLSGNQWADLYRLMRTDKHKAFCAYADHYLRTDGQVYWSDTHQLAGNFTGHRSAVDVRRGTEMITEVYIDAERVMPFLWYIREDLERMNADIMYGTIRFIEPDVDTFLPWAKRRSVCIICNLHVQHTPAGITKAKAEFRQIIDRAIEFDGSYFLTYHRWATSEQITTCYPKISEFFALKRKYDPGELFQSDWYRHYSAIV